MASPATARSKTTPKSRTGSGPRPDVVAREEVKSTAKWVRISPRKARLVTDHIRGRSVPEARTVLAFSDRAAAIEIDKVLRSAVANAEANHGLFGDDLVISAAYVDVGPTIKRWRARARGRVARIKKRTCHITIKVAQNPSIEPRKRRAPATPAAPADTPPATTGEATPAAEEAPKKTRTPRPKKDDATTAKPTSVKPSRSRQTKGDR
ncbi:MAG: large subunit ribosomal protein [Gaiellaceae bacterium]|jgi:large subunit ribosomal protein L22|nr:large subunit ribosomal protein [Gaiellaceae bacterium]